MSRLPLRPPGELDDAERALHGAIVSSRAGTSGAGFAVTDDDGALLGPFNAMLLSPEVGHHLQAVGDTLRRSTLTARERELVVLCVAAHHQSAFEWNSHAQAAERAGIDEETREALRHGDKPQGLDAREDEIFALTRLLLQRRALSDTQYTDAVATLGERAVFEVTVLVGYYELIALVLSAFNVT